MNNNQNQQVLSGRYTRVLVGNQVFDIPQEKAQQLVMMLQAWGSVSVSSENQNKFQGQSLILG
jgi:hypothetical protein